MNGEIEIASQVVRPELEDDAISTDHASSDAARAVGTMAVLNTTGRTRSSGLFPSYSTPMSPRSKRSKACIADDAPVDLHRTSFKQLVATGQAPSPEVEARNHQEMEAGPSRALPRISRKMPDAVVDREAVAPPMVPPSATSQGKRRIGLVAYSSTVASIQSSPLDRRTVLSDISSSGRNNATNQPEKEKGRKGVQQEMRGNADDQPDSIPKRGHPKSTKKSRTPKGPFATAPPAQGVPGSSKVFTIDSFVQGPGEGSYALPAAPPEDEKRRKRQRDAFEGVEAIDGDGPYAYYNSRLSPHIAVMNAHTYSAGSDRQSWPF